jgi:hypothetical protein
MQLSAGESGRGQDDLFIVEEGGRRQRQHDKALPKDEAEAVSSSWLHGKKARHSAVSWQHWPEERRHWRREREEMTLVQFM